MRKAPQMKKCAAPAKKSGLFDNVDSDSDDCYSFKPAKRSAPQIKKCAAPQMEMCAAPQMEMMSKKAPVQ